MISDERLIELFKDVKLTLAVDMYGCPNRCRHCWIGHMPNRRMNDGDDEFIVNYFRQYFNSIEYYSWLREPDYTDGYERRWERDNEISVNCKPQRFELGSFYRIVRDNEYVKFLKKMGTEKVQLTFFGLEKMTDSYIGRKGAFSELLKATEILIENGIAPRWQCFITEENKDEIVEVLQLSKELKLNERCREIGQEFKFFVHAGSCDGENLKLYPIRIAKAHIPKELIKYYWQYEESFSENELYKQLQNDNSHLAYEKGNHIILFISNTFDVFFNYTHMKESWRIGNLLKDKPYELMVKIKNDDVPAINIAKHITVGELVRTYGDITSGRMFTEEDYKEYLLLRHLND